MASIDSEGMLTDPRVIPRRSPHIEHGNLDAVWAIVIHQTDSSNSNSTMAAYASGGNGAHFLIDKNGDIYQTASLKKRCFHVGKLIKSRCMEIRGANCPDKEIAKAAALGWSARIKAIDKLERQKRYPDRFPVNSDSVSIELVGMHVDDDHYEPVTFAQSNALQWLIDQLYSNFSLTKNDVFRHPEISYKNPGEAESVKWK